MIDLLEIIFIWSLYIVLPVVLLTRFLGSRRAGLLFSGILTLYLTDGIDSIMFLSDIQSPTAIEQVRDSSKSGSFINRGLANPGGGKPGNTNPKPDKPQSAPKPLPDRGPRFNSGGPNGGSGDGNLPDVDGNDTPPSEEWRSDPEYWADYRYGEDGR